MTGKSAGPTATGLHRLKGGKLDRAQVRGGEEKDGPAELGQRKGKMDRWGGFGPERIGGKGNGFEHLPGFWISNSNPIQLLTGDSNANNTMK